MKNKIIFITLVTLLFSASYAASKNTVYLYKQWHLLAKVKTNDIQKSLKLSQYENQRYIYDDLVKNIDQKNIGVVISEGCEGEIDHKFPETFNGWNYKLLASELKSKKYKDILTLLPLKLEAKYKKELFTTCGDSKKLIEKHNLAFSDLRAYFGYYLRFKQFQNKNPKKFKIYKEALESTEKKKIKDPLNFSKKKALEQLNTVKELIKKRNISFVAQAKKHYKKNPAIIIGGLHVQDLDEKLRAAGLKSVIVKVKGYPAQSERLIRDMEDSLK